MTDKTPELGIKIKDTEVKESPGACLRRILKAGESQPLPPKAEQAVPREFTIPFGKLGRLPGERLVWRHGTGETQQQIFFHPARFFDPEKDGLDYPEKATKIGLEQLNQIFGPQLKSPEFRGDEFELKSGTPKNPINYNIERQVNLAIFFALDNAEGSTNYSSSEKGHSLTETNITRGNHTLVLERHDAQKTREVKRPLPGNPNHKDIFGRQVRTIKWMPTEKVERIREGQTQWIKYLGEIGFTPDKARREIERREKNRKRKAKRKRIKKLRKATA